MAKGRRYNLRRRQRSKPRKMRSGQRKSSPAWRKNTGAKCHVRFPWMDYQRSRQLRSLHFKRARPGKRATSSSKGYLPRRRHLQGNRQRKKQPRICPKFLRAKLKVLAREKRGKNVVAAVGKTAPKKQRYSDEEIFYKFANPSVLRAIRKKQRLAADPVPCTSNVVPRSENGSPVIQQPSASDVQQQLC